MAKCIGTRLENQNPRLTRMTNGQRQFGNRANIYMYNKNGLMKAVNFVKYWRASSPINQSYLRRIHWSLDSTLFVIRVFK